MSQHAHINCAQSSAMCTEVANSDNVFGHYVGHDEPSVLFNSNVPGSGNHMSYNVVLPKDPSASNPNKVNKSYSFELSGADWFGMAMCDTQSYPEQVKTCPPDSDKNILDPTFSPKHVGQAFMEMQFYPPGWIPWPTWQVAVGASSCDPTQVVRRDEHRQPVAQPGDRQGEQHGLLEQGGRGVRQLRLHHQERQVDGSGQPGGRDHRRHLHAQPAGTCS